MYQFRSHACECGFPREQAHRRCYKFRNHQNHSVHQNQVQQLKPRKLHESPEVMCISSVSRSEWMNPHRGNTASSSAMLGCMVPSYPWKNFRSTWFPNYKNDRGVICSVQLLVFEENWLGEILSKRKIHAEDNDVHPMIRAPLRLCDGWDTESFRLWRHLSVITFEYIRQPNLDNQLQ